ncbi:MAG: UV DNA damage repair endonuclease UvsE, partial [Chloroflexi bacterium]|nr:UV DNA damage repair endonuclease UvsE [Chloroflexota bacterium]
RRRIVLENDDRCFSAAEVLSINERCGVPLVFDWQHHQILNPQRIPWQEALSRCIASWPHTATPKIHFSSPRTELRSENGRIKVPSWTEHSDYVQPFEFIQFMRSSDELDFDIMLECKARDLALLKLRQDLRRFAPDLAVN